MDAFSYLSVLISIILGLGITQILTGAGRLLQARRRVRAYWPSLVWAAVIITAHVQTWWVMYGYRARTNWTFGAFLVVLVQPSILYMLSALALPEHEAHGTIDLRENYHVQTRWFFGLWIALLVQSVLRDLLLDHALPNALNLSAHVLFGATALAAAITRREWFHRVNAVATAALLAIYVTLLFVRLR